jgi:CRP/FNR family cyclic AMP-dependent transcriptional regulator
VRTDAAVMEKFKDPEWGASKLGEITIFRKFNQAELKRLYEHGQFMVLRSQSHAVIEGEATRGLYVILDGTVSVYKTDPANNSLARLAVLESGAYFGELSLFDSAPRSATVTAETTVQCFVLDADAFNRFLESMGENLQLRFYKTCAEELVDRLRKLNSDYISSQNMLWRYAFRHED